MIPKNRWNKYFYKMALTVASNSQCFSRQVGAVIVRDKSIISTGYNGPPRDVPRCDTRMGVDKTLDRYLHKDYLNPSLKRLDGCPRQALGMKSGEGLHLCPAAHGEVNAIANAAKLGVSVDGADMYLTCGIPCKNCLSIIINAGIRRVVCANMDSYDELSDYIVQHSELQISTYV